MASKIVKYFAEHRLVFHPRVFWFSSSFLAVGIGATAEDRIQDVLFSVLLWNFTSTCLTNSVPFLLNFILRKVFRN